jgi:hypothetical protein
LKTIPETLYSLQAETVFFNTQKYYPDIQHPAPLLWQPWRQKSPLTPLPACRKTEPISVGAARQEAQEAKEYKVMNSADQKCAHKNCTCPVSPNSQYCSPACESGKGSESACGCGHPGCAGAKEVAA